MHIALQNWKVGVAVAALAFTCQAAAAGWQIYFTGQAQRMFGSQGRGNFTTSAECQQYRSSQPAFERNNSVCRGQDDTGSNSATSPLSDPQTRADACNGYNDYGNSLMQTGDFSGAALRYRSALEFCPNDRVVKANLEKANRMISCQSHDRQGQSLVQKLRFADAARQFEQALRNCPPDWGIAAKLASAIAKSDPGTKIAVLQEQMNNLRSRIPPPLPDSEVDLSWQKRARDQKSHELYADLANDIVILGYDVAGTIGSKTVMPFSVLVIAGKSMSNGLDVATVYASERNDLLDRGLTFFKDKETARKFANVLRFVKTGQGALQSDDAYMLPAAQAVLNARSSESLFWDALLSPQARAAAVRKATIDLSLMLLGNAMTTKLSRHADVFNEYVLRRKEAQALALEGLGRTEKSILDKIFKDSNAGLALLYKKNVTGRKLTTYLGSIVLQSEVYSHAEPKRD